MTNGCSPCDPNPLRLWRRIGRNRPIAAIHVWLLTQPFAGITGCPLDSPLATVSCHLSGVSGSVLRYGCASLSRGAKAVKQIRHYVSGIWPYASEGCRSKVALLRQAHKVQAGDMHGSPVTLRHMASFVDHGQAFEEWQVRTKTGGEHNAIDGFMLPIGPNNTF